MQNKRDLGDLSRFVEIFEQNFVEIHRKDDQDDKLGSFVTDARTHGRTHKIYYPRELGTSVSTAHQKIIMGRGCRFTVSIVSSIISSFVVK